MKRLLFVCLGNICRSPLAEAIFRHKCTRRGVHFVVDSAGLGYWHEGERADPRTIEVGRRFGIEVTSIARQIRPEDLTDFDLLLAMDRDNRRGLRAMGADPERVRLMRSFDPDLDGVPEHELDVPDPYLGGAEGFVEVYHMLDRACEGLLDHLTDRASENPSG